VINHNISDRVPALVSQNEYLKEVLLRCYGLSCSPTIDETFGNLSNRLRDINLITGAALGVEKDQ
jgi:hypothetical protein